MDKYFKPEFNWRQKCDWSENFLHTDRSYLTMSLGYEVTLFIPFSKFKALDKNETDITNVSQFIGQIVIAFKDLVTLNS
jgi:hypothetical protein